MVYNYIGITLAVFKVLGISPVSMDLFIIVVKGPQTAKLILFRNTELIPSCPVLFLLFILLIIFSISIGSVGDKNIELWFGLVLMYSLQRFVLVGILSAKKCTRRNIIS